MRGWLNNLFGTTHVHLSKGKIVAFLDGELPATAKMRADRHLASCAICRRSHRRLQEARRHFALYVATQGAGEHWRLDAYRARFLEAVDDTFGRAPQTEGIASRALHALKPTGNRWRLALTSAVACTVIGLVIFGLRANRQAPALEASTLLDRAVSAEQTSARAAVGVVLQRVQIKTANGNTVREIYRDARGVRHLRAEAAVPVQGTLRQKLAEGHINWNAPLSASTYRTWHDGQLRPRDQVRQLDRHLLLLSTYVAEGAVASESITVRDTDFHPVARTVELRTSGHTELVEIAELDLKVVPWSAFDSDLFDPAPMASVSAEPSPSSLLSGHLRVPSDAQLDEAELTAKLVLNQLQADTGEQIELARSRQEVEVRGLVETDKRQDELRSQLRLVPHLKFSITSMEALSKDTIATADGVSSERTTAAAVPSPLDTYFATERRGEPLPRPLSQQLLADAVIVSQEGGSLADLENKYPRKENMSLTANATLLELAYAHRLKIRSALQHEEDLLKHITGTTAITTTSEATTPNIEPLVQAANANLKLCEELTLGGRTQARTAPAILSDLFASLGRLHEDLDQQSAATSSRPLVTGKR